MRGAERSAGNTAKNIALIVLAAWCGAVRANWLAGVSAASLGSDNPLRRVLTACSAVRQAMRSARRACRRRLRRSLRSALRASSSA